MPYALATRSSGSIAACHVAPLRAMNSRAAEDRSWKTTPITTSPTAAWRSAAACSNGNSSTHGPHQLAQKLSTTGRPRRLERRIGLPSRSASEKSGATLPWVAGDEAGARARRMIPSSARRMRGSVAPMTRCRNGRRRRPTPAPAAAGVVIGGSVRGSVIVRSVLRVPPLVVGGPNPGDDAQHEDEHARDGEERVGDLVL